MRQFKRPFRELGSFKISADAGQGRAEHLAILGYGDAATTTSRSDESGQERVANGMAAVSLQQQQR